MSYLDQDKYRACDEGLWLGLKGIVKSGKREVRYMEDDDILQATFFSECLDYSDDAKHGKRGYRPRAERDALRRAWFEKSLDAMVGKDIVCVDPDNGLVVPSAKGGPKENKYVLPSELAGYYAQGSSVIYYQHKARRRDPFYIQQHDELVRGQDFPGAEELALKFVTTSQRYYLFVMQPRHRGVVGEAVKDMLSTAWGEHFRLL